MTSCGSTTSPDSPRACAGLCPTPCASAGDASSASKDASPSGYDGHSHEGGGCCSSDAPAPTRLGVLTSRAQVVVVATLVVAALVTGLVVGGWWALAAALLAVAVILVPVVREPEHCVPLERLFRLTVSFFVLGSGLVRWWAQVQ